jgi:hypothetical protein
MSSLAFDPVQLFVDTASEAVPSAIGEFLAADLKERGFSEVFTAASGEFAKAMAGHIVGPLLMACLKIIDPTQRKLDAILREPLQTGVRLGRQALALVPVTPRDELLRREMFSASLTSLEKAYSYAENDKKSEDECSFIRLAQATVAKLMDAPGASAIYAQELLDSLEKQKGELARYLAEAKSCVEQSESFFSAQEKAEHRRDLVLKGARGPLLKVLVKDLDSNTAVSQHDREVAREFAANGSIPRWIGELQTLTSIREVPSSNPHSFERYMNRYHLRERIRQDMTTVAVDRPAPLLGRLMYLCEEDLARKEIRQLESFQRFWTV